MAVSLACVRRCARPAPRRAYVTAAAAAADDERRPLSEYVQPLIRTFRPEHLSEADHVHFPVDQHYCYLWDALSPARPSDRPPSPRAASSKEHRPFASFRFNDHQPFPAGLGGFFYYYTPPGPAPPAAGELRFRKTYDNNPYGWQGGVDLPSAHGLPWRIQLPTLAAFHQHAPIRNVLLRDRLVSPEDLDVAAQMGEERASRRETAPLIHSFHQPFFLDFGSSIHWWHFMGPDRIHFTRPMANILSIKHGPHRLPSPWLGGAICAFIPSQRRFQTPTPKRIISVRILRLLPPSAPSSSHDTRVPASSLDTTTSPPDADSPDSIDSSLFASPAPSSEPVVIPNPAFPAHLRGLVPTPPRAGDVIRRGKLPWSLDLDACEPWRADGFRVLFDNRSLPRLREGRLRGPPKVSENEIDEDEREREDGEEGEEGQGAR
ncbi:hypothetical protein C8Q79DRAFT_1084815 [Trametes meyenii]|nr:hypothetical protein C8Q79DRAFT_1084815 [Trametes meyenii]